MSVYVDSLFQWPNKRGEWCHMWADTLIELQTLAARIGIKKCWFSNKRGKGFPHYDLRPAKRALAIEAGAIKMELREWVAEKAAA